MAILANPFVIGLLIGLFIALCVWINYSTKVSRLEKHIITTMDTHTLNTEKIKKLEEQINNQKVTIQMLKQKPTQRDLRELRQYAEACAMMTKNAPGFAQAWQNCLDEIIKKEEEEEKGNILFAKPIQKLISIFRNPQSVINDSEKTENQNIDFVK